MQGLLALFALNSEAPCIETAATVMDCLSIAAGPPLLTWSVLLPVCLRRTSAMRSLSCGKIVLMPLKVSPSMTTCSNSNNTHMLLLSLCAVISKTFVKLSPYHQKAVADAV
jgi:hypothetical protein